MGVLGLDRRAFIKKQNAKYRFGDHVQCPFFGGEHLLEGEELSFESHFLHEWIDDFGVGFKRKPVLVLSLFHGMMEFRFDLI